MGPVAGGVVEVMAFNEWEIAFLKALLISVIDMAAPGLAS